MENDFKKDIKLDDTEKDKIILNQTQKDISSKIEQVMNACIKSNSYENREFLCYLTSAIYLTYKKLYPQINIHIPFRIKSDSSAIKNIQKELTKWIKNLKYKKGHSPEKFDITSTIKDLSGIRIVLDNINFSLPETKESLELFSDEELKKLIKKSHSNHRFINKVDDYIQSPIHTGEDYYKLKIDLLKRIIDSTSPEFTKERAPQPSFEALLEETVEQYQYYLSNPDEDFPIQMTLLEVNDLMRLTNDLRSRIDDKMHFAILRKTLPVVLSSPIIKNALLTNYKYDKEVLKDNAFHALYGNLETPFGNVEIISQSNKAFYDATKGPAFHSGMDGKAITIKDFFELVDPNDEKSLSYYLKILDSTSADSLISPYELPVFKTQEEKDEFMKTKKGFDYLQSEKYREMMEHIKIKDKLEMLPDILPADVYDDKDCEVINQKKLQKKIASGEIVPIVMDMNDYLINYALFSSSYMNVCSAGHTSYTNASIHHKKIIGEFAEILRKKDSNTCLRDMIIRRLELIIEKNGKISSTEPKKPLSNVMKKSLKKVRKHDSEANKLPKDVSFKNILSYAKKLREKLKIPETNEGLNAR